MADRNDLDLLHMLAFFYWRHNQAGRAAALAYAVYKLGRRDAKLLCLLAATLLKLGMPDRCLGILDEVMEPAEPSLQHSVCRLRARAWLHQGQIERARAEFRRSMLLLPATPDQSLNQL